MIMERSLTCIECPRGCTVTVVTDGDKVTSVTGNFCPKGKAYAVAELTDPVRVVTGSVRGENEMISVKTDRPVRKADIFEIMAVIRKVKVLTNVAIGDIIVPNIDKRGANLVATKPYSIKKQ